MASVTNFGFPVTDDGEDVTPFDISSIEIALAENGFEIDEKSSREEVKDRLADAIRLVHVTTGRAGPRGFGRTMPEYEYSQIDIWWQMTQTDWERERGDFDRNRPTIGATRQEIAEADEALAWIPRFVPEERYRKALNSWLLSKALKRPWTRITKQSGMNHRTACSRRDRAIALIVYGLALEAVEKAKAEETAPCT